MIRLHGGAPGTSAGRALSAVGMLASCVPMLAMMPGAFAGALGLVGLSAGSGLATFLSEPLAPVAKPLLLASTALLVAGGLRCSRAAAVLPAAGGGLLYLSMYAFTSANGSTAPIPFYIGLALLLAGFVTPWLRPRLARCRPLLARRGGQRAIAATLAAGIVAVATATALHTNTPASHTSPSAPGASGQSMSMGGMSPGPAKTPSR